MKLKFLFSLFICFQYLNCSQEPNNNLENVKNFFKSLYSTGQEVAHVAIDLHGEYEKNKGKVEAYENVFKQQPQNSNNLPNQQIQTDIPAATPTSQPKADIAALALPDINVKTSVEITHPTQSTLDQVTKGALLVGNTIVIAKGLHDGYYFARSIVAPTEEQKLHDQQVKDELEGFEKRKELRKKQVDNELKKIEAENKRLEKREKRLESKEKLNDCLIKYQNSKKDPNNNMPIKCDEHCRAYQRIAGLNAYNHIAKAFQEFSKNNGNEK